MKSRMCFIVAVLLSFSQSTFAESAPFSLTDLGTLSGDGVSFATALNETGQIVGQSYSSGGQDRAFIWSNGSMQDLGTGSSYAAGINDLGQVVGHSQDGGFLWTNGLVQNLGVVAEGVNNLGQVVGTLNSGHPFLYSNSSIQDFGFDGSANAINDGGQIAGTMGAGPAHGFLYSSGVRHDFNFPSRAYGINSSGHVVGYASGLSDDGEQHAFLWVSGLVQDLGILGHASTAYGVNDSDQVVGRMQGGHAFLWSSGLMQDLNSLIDPALGWELQQANAINDVGQIVGYGTNGLGESHAFLLTPVPEPTTLILLGLGATLLSFRRVRN